MATEQAYDNEVTVKKPLNIKTGDTLRLKMQEDVIYHSSVQRHNGFEIQYDENEEKVIYSNDIRLIVRSTKDSTATVSIVRSSEGNSLLNAKKRAEAIDYNYTFENNTLSLGSYFTTKMEQGYRDQEVEIILYLPEGSILVADDNTYSFHRNSSQYGDILDNNFEGYHLLILDKDTKCLDCPVEIDSENEPDTTDESEESIEKGNSDSWEEEVNRDLTDEEAQVPITEEPEAPINNSTTDSLTIKTNSNEDN